MTIRRGIRDEFHNADLCVVGAGPVGIALSMACEAAGLSVLLLESGKAVPDPAQAALSAGHKVDLVRHAAPNLISCRSIGGTSRLWGGRCVPFDAIDFETRAYVPDAHWPILYGEVARWHSAAAKFFGVTSGDFSASAGEAWIDDLLAGGLERWAPRPDLGRVYRAHLEASHHITVATDTTVTGLSLSEDGRSIVGLDVADGSGRKSISPKRVVLACGGLETTRLLLATQAQYPTSFGGRNGALGRFYMGHLSGRIADVVLQDPASVRTYDFFLDSQAFARRRMTISADVQRRDRLQNIAFWIDNPAFYEVGHRNGVLSLVWLALAVAPLGRRLVSEAVRRSHLGQWPAPVLPHLRNALRTPLTTARELARIAGGRFLGRHRQPGFIVRHANGRYALHYHAEQAPNRESRVRLAEGRDAYGLPFLDIDLRFSEQDARSVVCAHARLDEELRESGHALLDYRATPDERVDAVLAQAHDGFHQIGTTRMGTDPRLSVVDSSCRVHGMENLFLASSAIFPSSGQANPTFLAVTLALRLADHLQANAKGTHQPSTSTTRQDQMVSLH